MKIAVITDTGANLEEKYVSANKKSICSATDDFS